MRYIFHFCSIAMLMSGFQANQISAQVPGKLSSRDSIKVSTIYVPFLMQYPLTTWPRKNPAVFGCMLESHFGYKDSMFNCARSNYVNKGDPCKNTKEYYEGLQIPDNISSLIYPLFKTITLDFEHGNLQNVSIEFNDSIAIDMIKMTFRLPSDRNQFPDNIMDIRYGENVSAPNKPRNPRYTRWLEIVGFDHIGSGDVDCK